MNRIKKILNTHLFQAIFIGLLALLLLRTTGANAAQAASCGQWNIVTSPGTSTNGIRLQGVSALSATDVWAVGDLINSNLISQTLIEHWDGTQWSIISSPNVNGAADNGLAGVAALSATNIWAAGGYNQHFNSKDQTLIEHWDGTQWNIVPSPNPPQAISSFLDGVAASSANNVWAVGDYFSRTDNLYHTLTEFYC